VKINVDLEMIHCNRSFSFYSIFFDENLCHFHLLKSALGESA